MQEEGTDNEINDVMLMGEPDPTIISANLDEKLEHSGEAEAKRINAKYGVLPNDQCLTVLEMTVSVIWLICMFEIYIVNALMNLAPALKVPSMSSLIVPKQFTE